MINVFNEKYRAIIEDVEKRVLARFNIEEEDVEVEVDFLSPEEMQSLNKESRGVDSLTDVLSFPSLEINLPFIRDDYPDDIDPETDAVILGEIYISEDRALEQAEEIGNTPEEEIAFLVCHGMLHLLGFDHMEESEAEEMYALQREILGRADDGKTDTYNEGAVADYKYGNVAVVGRANAGKSTFVNSAVGEKVSIVSWKPQTTRNGIMGIYTDNAAQIVFIDTPGLHSPKNRLGRYMMKSVSSALEDADVILYVVDGEKGLREEDKRHISRYLESGLPMVVAVNKVDHIEKSRVMEILTSLSQYKEIAAVVPMSALRGRNVKAVLDELKALLPEGEKRYEDDDYTLSDMRFMAAEIIREKALRLLGEEVPYGIGVSINKYEYRETGNLIDIDADIVVEKKNHKGIVLGKGGAMIKKIATYSRIDLEEITGAKIFLTLWVRVKEEWRNDQLVLSDLGYVKKKEN